MNAELSRRVAKLMSTSVIQNLELQAHNALVDQVAKARSFEDLTPHTKDIILTAEVALEKLLSSKKD